MLGDFEVNWLLVEPTPLKNIICSSKWRIFPNFRGENKKKVWNHQLESYCWWLGKSGIHQLRLVVYPSISRVLYIQPVVVRDFWSINNRNPPTYTGVMSREPTYRCAHNSTNRGEITSVTPLIRPFIGVRAPFKTSHCMTPTQTSCNFLEGNPSKRPTFVFIPPPQKKATLWSLILQTLILQKSKTHILLKGFGGKPLFSWNIQRTHSNRELWHEINGCLNSTFFLPKMLPPKV